MKALLFLLILLPHLVFSQAEFSERYDLYYYCELYDGKRDSCVAVDGSMKISHERVTISLSGRNVSFQIATSFKFRSKIYYHLRSEWYNGFLIYDEGNTDTEGVIHSKATIDLQVIGERSYTARLSLKQ